MAAKSVLATVFLCLYFPVPLTMLWFHGFHNRWARMGARSYALHVPFYLLIVTSLAATHGALPWRAWVWHPALAVIGAALVVGAFVLLAITYRDIDSWTAMAGPQITQSPQRRLITSGIYGVIRHPRYAVLILGSLGNFLLTGYPLIGVSFVVTTLLSLWVIEVEEKELVRTFGEDYKDYRRRVPSLVPRRGTSHRMKGTSHADSR